MEHYITISHSENLNFSSVWLCTRVRNEREDWRQNEALRSSVQLKIKLGSKRNLNFNTKFFQLAATAAATLTSAVAERHWKTLRQVKWSQQQVIAKKIIYIEEPATTNLCWWMRTCVCVNCWAKQKLNKRNKWKCQAGIRKRGCVRGRACWCAENERVGGAYKCKQTKTILSRIPLLHFPRHVLVIRT